MPRPLIVPYDRAAKAADRLFNERKSVEAITAHTLRTACGGRGDHATYAAYLDRWKVERRHVTAETALVQVVEPFWREDIDEAVSRIVHTALVMTTRELRDDNHRLRSALSRTELDSERLRGEIKKMGDEIDRLYGGPRRGQ